MSEEDWTDWAEPFRRQAEEDLRAAIAANGAGCPSTAAMLIQMVFEKLAKANMAKVNEEPQRRHDAILDGKLWAKLMRHPDAPMTVEAVEFVERVTMWNPTNASRAYRAGVGSGVQLEYPWRDATLRAVIWPGGCSEILALMAPDEIGFASACKCARAVIDGFGAL